MMFAVLIAALVQAAPAPVPSQAATDTALLACERWLLDPREGADAFERFTQARGLGAVATVPPIALPPAAARKGMHHWQVNAGTSSIFVSVSDQAPICHMAGGGPDDLYPGAEAVFEGAAFGERWKRISQTTKNRLRIARYAHASDPRLVLNVTRAAVPDARRDKLQLVATARYEAAK